MRSPKLLIFGAGAMGCTLAWHLAGSGVAVTLAARGQALQAIQARGLGLWSEGQARASVAVQAVDAADLAWDFDFIIVCVKQYDLAAALQTLSPAMGRGSAASARPSSMRSGA
ncbi:MAG: 2-dehydropantoate 2-reductase [Comamonas sp.]|uniref:ketopantoate reductase family protein n=1 Tax=Comamonas sp. TaxID=34028 RepID=UPI002FCCAC1D